MVCAPNMTSGCEVGDVTGKHDIINVQGKTMRLIIKYTQPVTLLQDLGVLNTLRVGFNNRVALFPLFCSHTLSI
jgi:hypothetical protein